MLVEVIELNNSYYIDHTQIANFDIKVGDDVLFADIVDEVYANPLSKEYDNYIDNNIEEYLDLLWTYYHEF